MAPAGGQRLAMLIMLALLLALMPGRDGRAGVEAGGPGGGALPTSPDFSISVSAGESGAQKDGCSTLLDDATCAAHPGSAFTVRVSLDDLGTLPDTDRNGLNGYTGFEIALHYSAGLTPHDRPNECEPFPFFFLQDYDYNSGAGDNGYYLALCYAPGEVQYAGVLADFDFSCPPYESTETITIVHGPDGGFPFDTHLFADDGTRVPEAGAAETLVVNCTYDFPWDVNGDGAVTGSDIFGVMGHFGEEQPAP